MDFPIQHGDNFHSYVSYYQRVDLGWASAVEHPVHQSECQQVAHHQAILSRLDTYSMFKRHQQPRKTSSDFRRFQATPQQAAVWKLYRRYLARKKVSHLKGSEISGWIPPVLVISDVFLMWV